MLRDRLRTQQSKHFTRYPKDWCREAPEPAVPSRPPWARSAGSKGASQRNAPGKQAQQQVWGQNMTRTILACNIWTKCISVQISTGRMAPVIKTVICSPHHFLQTVGDFLIVIGLTTCKTMATLSFCDSFKLTSKMSTLNERKSWQWEPPPPG